MSYAGTYGPNETCEHDTYWKNCWRCNGSVERFAREWPNHIAHAEAVESVVPPIKERTVVVYDVGCPGCDLLRTFDTEDEAQKWFAKHADGVRRTEQAWRLATDMHEEMRRQGIGPGMGVR